MTRENETMPRPCVVLGRGLEKAPPTLPYRQFNFAVDVVVTGPVELHEHDSYTWTALNEELPVTDAVQEMLRRYCEVKDI